VLASAKTARSDGLLNYLAKAKKAQFYQVPLAEANGNENSRYF
jgi:hypothetical protein